MAVAHIRARARATLRQISRMPPYGNGGVSRVESADGLDHENPISSRPAEIEYSALSLLFAALSRGTGEPRVFAALNRIHIRT